MVIGSDEQIVCLKRYLNRHTSSRNIVVFRDIGSHATKHSILRHKRSCSGINGIRHAVQRTEIKENSAAAEDPNHICSCIGKWVSVCIIIDRELIIPDLLQIDEVAAAESQTNEIYAESRLGVIL